MNATDLQNQSLAMLSQRILGYEVYAFASPIGLLGYLFIIVTIICSKDLHNKTHCLMLSQAICDIGRSFSYLGLGLGHYISFLYMLPVSHTYIFCMLINFPLSIVSRCNVYFIAALGTDRFLGVAFPAWYYGLSMRKYVFVVNAFCYCLGCFFTAVYDGSTGNFEKMAPICEDFVFIPAEIRLWTNTANIVEMSLVTSIYLLSALFMWRRYYSANPIGKSQKSEWRRQVDFKVFLVVGAMGIIFLFTTLAPRLIYIAASTFPSFSSPSATYVVGVFFYSVRSLSYLTINLVINSKFRAQFLRLFCKRNPNAVTSIVGSQHPV